MQNNFYLFASLACTSFTLYGLEVENVDDDEQVMQIMLENLNQQITSYKDRLGPQPKKHNFLRSKRTVDVIRVDRHAAVSALEKKSNHIKRLSAKAKDKEQLFIEINTISNQLQEMQLILNIIKYSD